MSIRDMIQEVKTTSSSVDLPPLFPHWVTLGLPLWALVQAVKTLPEMREARVWSLSQEDHWRREWQPTPVSLPGESHGQRSLVGCSPRGRRELDTTEGSTPSLSFTL